MTRAEVIGLMGQPGADSLNGEVEVMTYHVDRRAGWALAMQCSGAAMAGKPAPYECNPANREESFLVITTDGKVTAYGISDKPLPSEISYTPQITPQDLRQNGAETQQVNSGCQDAMRRYKLGVISFDQVENACH